MAVAWLTENGYRHSLRPFILTQKKRELVLNPYLEAVGSARIMEISPKPALSREQKAVSLPLYCIL